MGMYNERKQNISSYIPSLDGLRAIAVLAVLAYHFNFEWASGGLLGVCLFFVLSGYLITDILINQWNKSSKINLSSFLLRRARRLLPALLVMLAGTVVWTSLYTPSNLASLRGDVLSGILYTSNWWLIFHQVSYFDSFGLPSPLGHLWSLAVEGQFYLLWPIFIYLGLRFLPKNGWLIALTLFGALGSSLAMAMLYQPGTDPSRVYYGTDTRAFALLIGAGLALILSNRKLSVNLSSRKRLLLDILGSAALAAILFMIWQTNEYNPFLYQGGLLLFSLLSALLIAVLVHPASRLAAQIGKQPLRWLGTRSYAIYLWHYPIIVLSSPSVNTGGVDLALILKQFAACLILAELSWHLVEKPIRFNNILTKSMKMTEINRTAIVSKYLSLTVAVTSLGLSVMTIIGIISINTQYTNKLFSIKPFFSQVSSMGIVSIPPSTSISQNQNKNQTLNQTQNQIPEPDQSQRKPPKDTVYEPPADTSKLSGSGKGVTIIGDSVMVGAESAFKELLPGIKIDAQIGRQLYQANSLLSQLKAQGELGDRIIIELGTNGPFSAEQLGELLDSLKDAKQVLLINTRVPRPWQDEVNKALKQYGSSYTNTTLIDWYSASSNHDDYFYQDGVHLTPKGIDVYTSLIIKELNLKS